MKTSRKGSAQWICLAACAFGFSVSPEGLAQQTSGLAQEQEDQLAEKQTQVDRIAETVEASRRELATTKALISKQEKEIAELEKRITDKRSGSDSTGTQSASGLPSQFLSDVANQIVVIEGDRGNGTGFLCTAGDTTYIYTAAHVLSGNRKINVRDQNGQVYNQFEYLECAEGVDLVRLKPMKPGLKGLEIATGSDLQEIGDTIVAVGNSLGTGSLSGEPGKITGIEDEMWEVDAEIIPGNSGGPVLALGSGKVVGIVTHLTIRKTREQEKAEVNTEVKRFAARLDKKWEWRKMPVSRFVNEWTYIEEMDKDSSIAWASIFLMHTGPKNTTSDPELLRIARSIIGRDRNNFQVQRVKEWLRRYDNSSIGQRNELIDKGNAIIKRNLEDIRLKKTDPQPSHFSWYHRQLFKDELEWRKRLTKSLQ